MASLVIRARFPLGTFLGHRDVGRVSEFPDTARLHAALLHSAGKGSTAQEIDGELRPSEEALSALKWLEQHPPESLNHPGRVRVATRPAHAWRSEGVMESAKAPSLRRTMKSQSDAVAVSGSFEWGWVDAPEWVTAMIDLLCADVSCLGEADSPVVLEAVQVSRWLGALKIDPVQTGFPSPGGLAVRTPQEGRVAELEADYREANPLRRPSAAADRNSWSALPSSAVPSTGSVRDYVYRPDTVVPDSPWSTALVVETLGRVDPALSVPWSVAFHRALVARLPSPAPSLITGKYLRGSVQPANRVAIQVLAPNPYSHVHLSQPAFLVMVPTDANDADLAALEVALTGMKKVYCREGQALLRAPQVMDATAFWKAPAEGFHRFWRPLPALVPEVRRQRTGGDERWTMAEAAALSVAYVLRDRFKPGGFEGARRHIAAARAAAEAGVRVHEPHRIRDSRLDRYAHKTPADVTVQPYTALIDVNHLLSPTTLFALGQSRHLGGGLMFPEDVATSAARVRGLLQ